MDFILNIVLQSVLFTFIGFGIYLSFVCFKIPDITTDGSFTLGGTVAAVALCNGLNWMITLPIAAVAGAISGALTGIIHTKVKVHPLLAGIITMTALYSINLLLLGRPNQPLLSYDTLFTFNNISFQLMIALLFLLIVGLKLVWFLNTDYGLTLRATGDNENFASSIGIKTDRSKVVGLAIANAFTAVSGALIAQQQGFSDINMGIGIVITGLAAVIIGQKLFDLFKTRKLGLNLVCIAVGCIVFRSIIALAIVSGIDPSMLKLTSAILLLIVLVVTNYKTISNS